MSLSPMPPGFASSRSTLHRIAVHLLARGRHAVVGRIDLEPTPGGFGTPTFGDDHRVIRLAGHSLFVSTTTQSASTRSISVPGSTLRDLAEFAGVDLSSDFSAGHDTPPLGDVDAPIDYDPSAVAVLGAWFSVGAQVIDSIVVALPAEANPSRARIWPEHFDLGTDIGVNPGRSNPGRSNPGRSNPGRINLGASAGDSFSASPYLYVGPWDAARPGDASYWNAPFGATLGYDDVSAGDDPVAAGVSFMSDGVSRFR